MQLRSPFESGSDESKKKRPSYKLRVAKSELKLQRPVFLCPLPYCAGHAMNINRHRIVAHPEIKAAKDIELYNKLVENMKCATIETVATLEPHSMTANRALLQKMKPQIATTDNEPIGDKDGSREDPQPSISHRKHYRCPACDKWYPSIGQHIDRKHKAMDAQEKLNLRKKMVAQMARKPPTKAPANPEFCAANLNTTLTKMYKHIPQDVSAAIADFVSQIGCVISQREVNFMQTVGLIKRIVLYCLKFATTNLPKHGSFDWKNTLTFGIKDLLNENNLDKLSVDGSVFSPMMKKKTLNALVKLLNFHQESFASSSSAFPLITEEQTRMLKALMKARSARLDPEVREHQTNIAEDIYEETDKCPTIKQVFYACDRAPVKKILLDIIGVGTAVEEGRITNVAKLERKEMIKELEHGREEPATIQTAQRTARVSLQQYRRALILAICCKNAPRSMEILKYSVEEYKRDRMKYLKSEDQESMVLPFQQHQTAKNRKAAIALVQGLAKDALYHYVYHIRPFIAPPTLKNVFFNTYGQEISYAGLNKNLTRVFQLAYPDTDYAITTRTFRRVVTSFCRKDAAPDLAEEVAASLLCQDPTTAKRAHAMRSKSIAPVGEEEDSEPREGRVTEQPETETGAATEERQLAGPSAPGGFALQTFLEELQPLTIPPREKFIKIFEQIGPVRLPSETFVRCLTPSQRKTGRTRLNQSFTAALAAYKSARRSHKED